MSETQQLLLQRFLAARASQRATVPVGIAPRPADVPACLSVGQEYMWKHMRLNPELTCYNEPMTIHRQGPVDLRILERSFTELRRRHKAWRTTFTERNGEPEQVIRDTTEPISVPISDLRSLPLAARDVEALRLASQDACIPFDLERGPLFRARVVRLGDEDYKLFITAHHIILDGVTVFDIFFSELVACYTALLKNQMPSLPELSVQFDDFAYWQRQHMQDESMVRQLAYWRKQLAGQPEPAQLQADSPRPQQETYRGAIRSFALTKPQTDRLRRFSQQQGVAMFVTLVAAYITLLHRYTAQQDITVGTVVPGARKEQQLQRVMGLLQTRMPLRVDLSGDPSIRELLMRVRTVISEALCHDDVPFEIIARDLQPDYERSRRPFFDTMITLEPRVPDAGPGWDFTTMDAQSGGARLDLYIEMDDRATGMLGRAQYNSGVFSEEAIVQLTEDFQATIDALVEHPERSLSGMSPLCLTFQPLNRN